MSFITFIWREMCRSFHATLCLRESKLDTERTTSPNTAET